MLAGTSLGVATIVGRLTTELVAPLKYYRLTFSARVSLYIGASNLVPEFQSKRDFGLQMSFFARCSLYFVARKLICIASCSLDKT